MDSKKIKVAIVHDWLTHYGGAERCLEVFCEMFPNADIFTLVYDEGKVGKTIETRSITTSFLQKIPFAKRYYRYLLPLMPLAIEQFRFDGYDLVISSSHSVAKGVITPTDTLHVSYIYTPMRYIWFMEDKYFDNKSLVSKVLQIVTKPILHYLRIWDKSSTYRADRLVTISQNVKDRIDKVYRKNAEIIYPPIEIKKLNNSSKQKTDKDRFNFYLMITNYEPNKNTEVVIKAFAETGRKLVTVGSFGRLGKKLKSKYSKFNNIEFLGHIDDKDLLDLYNSANALIAPGNEDFGMAVLEANAAGTPVIAYNKGGHLETVRDAEKNTDIATGIFFNDLSISAIIEAIKKFEDNYNKLQENRQVIKDWAQQFSKQRFKTKFKKILDGK